MDPIDGFLEKAERSFDFAERTLDYGHIDFAASRAYYAIFYIASALLEARGIRFRKHSAVVGQFGLYFAKPRILDPAYHRLLIDAQHMRLEADYQLEPVAEEDVVREFIADGRAFLDAGRAYLASR
jgi:uncharacterized protein (UPF0332 family)